MPYAQLPYAQLPCCRSSAKWGGNTAFLMRLCDSAGLRRCTPETLGTITCVYSIRVPMGCVWLVWIVSLTKREKKNTPLGPALCRHEPRRKGLPVLFKNGFRYYRASFPAESARQVASFFPQLLPPLPGRSAHSLNFHLQYTFASLVLFFLPGLKSPTTI